MKGTDLALSDPLKWSEEVALPAMRAKGVDTENRAELTKALATMFRNSNSNMFADAMMQSASRSRLHKDEDNIGRAGTLDEIYKRNLASDPTASMAALSASLDNLMTTASSPAMQAAASGITALSGGLQTLADAAKDHPNLAMGGGAALAGGALAGTGWLTYQLATGFGLGTSATALTASAAALDGAAAALTGTAPAKAAATAATAAGGAGLGFGLGGIGVAVGAVVGGVMDSLTPGTGGGLWGAVTGQESSLAQTMRVMREERERAKGSFAGRGSLPPGTAGAPQPAPARLPGLDGRPKAAPVEVRQPGFGDATPKIPPMVTQRVEVAGADAAKTQLAEVKAKGEEVGGLNISVPVTVAGAGTAIQQLQQIIALGRQANQTIASVNGSGGALKGRSFSDGVTPGAGAQ